MPVPMNHHENINWKTLINTVLGRDTVDFDIATEDNEIVIRTNQEGAIAIRNKLRYVLQTPTTFQRSLPYNTQGNTQAQAASGMSQDEDVVEVPQPDNNVESGKDILINIFGQNTLDQILNIGAVFGEGARSESHVLFSTTTKRKARAKTWISAAEDMLAYFKGVDIETVRNAWMNNQDHLPEPADDMDDDRDDEQIVSELIQQCFGVITRENPTSVEMYFNYGRLYEFLYPPVVPEPEQIEVEENTGFDYEIRINKNHMLSYLQQLNRGGSLFRVYKENEQAQEFLARPIFIGREGTVAKPHYYSLVKKIRSQGQTSIPAPLSIEKKTNPFLRCDVPEVVQAAQSYSGKTLADPVETLSVIRKWKNELR